MLDRHAIQTMLQHVADGKVSLDQATERLMQGRVPQEGSRETDFPQTDFSLASPNENIAAMIDRLGTPPEDVVECWCDQLRDVLQPFEPFSCDSNVAIPSLELADLSLSPDGILHLRHDHPCWFEVNGNLHGLVSQVPNKGAQSIEQVIDDFRQLVLSQSMPGQETFVSSTDSPRHPVKPSEVIAAGPALSSSRSRHRVIFALLAGGILTIAVLAWGKHRHQDSIAPGALANFSSTSSEKVSAITETFSVNRDTTAKDRLPFVTEGSLESLDDLPESEVMSSAFSVDSFSLDSLIPAVTLGEAVSGLADPVAPVVPGATSESTTEMAKAWRSDSQTPSDDDDALAMEDPEPTEIQQPTRASSQTQFIRLPETGSHSSLTIDVVNPASLSLGFPEEVAIAMEAEAGSQGSGRWTIRDQRKKAPLAILSGTTQGLTFNWTDPGGRGSKRAAMMLAHGRLVINGDRKVFLRPMIQAEAWQIKMNQPDVRPTWDLGMAVLPGVSRLSLDLGLPEEEVEMTWIEPIPHDSPRRAQGLAVLKPLDGESVGLAMRFDVRCHRQLSCRIRYAARLDASTPWQRVSTPLLEQFADQVAQRLQWTDGEAERLQRVYDSVGTRGKRIIRVKRKRNQALAKELGEIADRVAQLQGLMAAVESRGVIEIRVWVPWPETQQMILVAARSEDP